MRTRKVANTLHLHRLLRVKDKSISNKDGGSSMEELNNKYEAAENIRSTLLIQQRKGNTDASFLLRRLP